MESRLLLLLLCSLFTLVSARIIHHDVYNRSLSDIARLKKTADRIIDFTVNGKGQNQTYNRLAEFVDKFGSRLT